MRITDTFFFGSGSGIETEWVITVPRIDDAAICVLIASDSGDGLSNHIDKGRSADEPLFINIAVLAQKL
jgi:hypothetical protein